jgi:hypothetical protein
MAYPDAELPSAPVEIDGNVLFRVRGTSAFPAEKRAAAIAGRIEALAADARVPADAVRTVEVENGTGWLCRILIMERWSDGIAGQKGNGNGKFPTRL